MWLTRFASKAHTSPSRINASVGRAATARVIAGNVPA
jgi:hypothetical protein